ncbi:MAG: hypothetical protein IJ637_07445 [Prevotella sp.]|nr:hypothetical protein [Prevotella sp.]
MSQNSYDDIIDMPRHVSKKHQPMTLLQRGALFAPFAALNGHSKAINDTAQMHIAEVDADLYTDMDYAPEVYIEEGLWYEEGKIM